MNELRMKVWSLCFLFFLVFFFQSQAQEFNAKVVIDHRQIQGTNVSVFETLEGALTEFVNNRNWTDNEYLPGEQIECNFFLNLTDVEDKTYTGSLMVTARRPIYNASISTTLLNIVDNDFTFTYDEYDQLVFNKTSLKQDLTAIFAFYIYTVLGVDADTFERYGGTFYYNQAQSIANTALSSDDLNDAGWDRLDSEQNRAVLISELISSEFKLLRSYLYSYHRKGLDVMADDPDKGVKTILNEIRTLESVDSRAKSSYLMQVFFDAKSDEIQSIVREYDEEKFKKLSIQKDELITLLKKLDPGRSSEYGRLSK